jgi:hypothetical protein
MIVGSKRKEIVRTAVGCLALLAALAAPAGAAPPEFAAAVAAAERGDFTACAAEFERLGAAASQDGFARRAFYGGAVCAAQGGALDSAHSLLSKAIARGFHDKDRFYFDPRLLPLRRDARWVELERAFLRGYATWERLQNADLAQLVKEDQEDRRGGAGGIDWELVAPRDRERCLRVKAILAAGGARTPDDRFNAALVLQHSDEIVDLELAHRLAKEAAEADADLATARWLAAAALDRSLVRAGKPQRYGTQSILQNGRWIVAEVDPAVTDGERALWEVPPLAESRRRVEAMNAARPAPPSPPEPPAPPEPAVPPAAPAPPPR